MTNDGISEAKFREKLKTFRSDVLDEVAEKIKAIDRFELAETEDFDRGHGSALHKVLDIIKQIEEEL